MRPSPSPRERVRTLIDDASRTLRDAGVVSPEVDARLIAADLLGVGPLDLSMYAGELPADFEREFSSRIARRADRTPVQHILGTAPFGPLDLEVGPGVFIPRPETELLADWAVRELGSRTCTVVDFGTGTGALAIYIATHAPQAHVIAVEKSDAARAYAVRNVGRYEASISGRVDVVPGDMADPKALRELDGAVDLVVANPPYVPETNDLDPEVYRDPYDAVFSGVDGMDAIRGLVPVAARLLKGGGALGIEHDDVTAPLVVDELRAEFTDIESRTDLAGRPRFVTARKKV